MKSSKRPLLRAAWLLLLPLCGMAQADWVQSSEALAVRPLPDNMQSQPQNPPTFTWSRHATLPPAYVVQVMQGGVLYKTFNTSRNWYLPPKSFPVGNYTWRVRPSTSQEWSSPRNFVIGSNSQLFEVPENVTLRNTILSKPRPRALPSGTKLFSTWTSAMRTDRTPALNGLTNEVKYYMTALKTVSDAEWPLVPGAIRTAAVVAQAANIMTRVNPNARQLEGAALLYRLTGEKIYLDEAIRRGDQFAALNITGPTSFVNQDMASRVMAQSLMKAIDNLGTALVVNGDTTRRTKWLSVVAARTNALYKDLSANGGRLDQYPYDSHAATSMAYLTLTSTLALGDIPEAQTWFDFAFRAFASSFSIWSGPEGGFANGTAYAEYEADFALQIWPALAQATGVNMFDKPWSRGFAQFLMHFVPPGQQTHVFGDGHETAPEFRFMKGFASRYATPQSAWYVKNLTRPDDVLATLQSPYPMPVNTVTATPTPPANAAYYPSIGWTAMHSNLADSGRTSLYFKSSAYGSFNHSHGDQNGFVLFSGGVPLLTETGWYDWYDSPLWNSWYRPSKSHNALTFDGGIGQNVDGYEEPLARNGRIMAFSTTPAVDYVEGDATLAYAGQLKSAVRKIWYVRGSNTAVILDQFSSATPRVFEWNFHGYAPIVVDAAGKISVTNQSRSVCIVPLTTTAQRFERRVGPPPQAGTYEDHGVFVKAAAATSGEFLTVLDVGCKNTAVKLDTSGGLRKVIVGTQTLTLPLPK
ncbi:heparinase II/III family protein [Janthinobacterium sp. FW305-129]|uniref:heparinase II/III domain-containing protein n=1 Tax=Janthinobacterium sp. FW305-129 TaxID=2775054 RepID=UPI001E2BDFF8|nr:heparinase II/III family protein [Janthinobacterium sp. FW305-129]MCC7596615.1 heparinase II/III family protein [Janthinobacterium sp. FW305-129]